MAKATCVPELPAFEAWKPSLAHGPADSSPLFQAGSRLRPAWTQPAWPTGPTWQPRALRQTSAPGHRPAAPSALASPPAPARPGSGSPPPWNKAAAPLPSPGQGAPVQVLPSCVQGARGSVCGLSPDGGPFPPETTCPCLPGTGRAPRTGDRVLDPQHPPCGFQRTFPRGLRHRTPTRRARVPAPASRSMKARDTPDTCWGLSASSAMPPPPCPGTQAGHCYGRLRSSHPHRTPEAGLRSSRQGIPPEGPSLPPGHPGCPSVTPPLRIIPQRPH